MLNVRYKEKTNAWPGFVDLFSNLAIILIFLLIVFVFLWTTTSIFNKNSGLRTVSELRQANAEQAALIKQMENDEQRAKQLLLLARDEITSNESSVADLSKAYEIKLQELEQQTASLQNQVQELQANRNLTTKYEDKITELEKQVNRQKNERDSLVNQIDDLQKKLDKQAEIQTAVSTAEMEKLQSELANTKALSNAEMEKLQSELADTKALSNAEIEKLRFELASAKAEAAAAQAQYITMSNELNKALADKVAELNEMAKYQSAFYKAIKDALGERTIAPRWRPFYNIQ